MSIVVFEDEHWERFQPLSTFRHLSLLACGTSNLFERAKEKGKDGVTLAGRTYLEATTNESTGVELNPKLEEEVLMVNARLRPSAWNLVERMKRGNGVLLSGDQVALATVNPSTFRRFKSENGVIPQRELRRATDSVGRLETSQNVLFSYPWELVLENGQAITARRKEFKNSVLPHEQCFINGSRAGLAISPSALVEQCTFFDTRNGPIIIDDDAEVEAFSRLTGPCFIGKGSKIHSALIRGGTTIGEGCLVGGEVENSIISPHTNKAHDGYLGHSVVGEWVNIGAGSVFSDLKNTYGTVRIEVVGRRTDTGLHKLGAVVGDMAKIAIGCRVFTGRKIGVASHAMELVTRDIPDFVFYDGRDDKMIELELGSVVETQRRMMSRRGLEMSSAFERLVRRIYTETEERRRKAGASKEKLGT